MRKSQVLHVLRHPPPTHVSIDAARSSAFLLSGADCLFGAIVWVIALDDDIAAIHNPACNVSTPAITSCRVSDNVNCRHRYAYRLVKESATLSPTSLMPPPFTAVLRVMTRLDRAMPTQ